MPSHLKYVEFAIPKRNGGLRTVEAPCKRLKDWQGRLNPAFYEAHSPTAATHGFTLGRNIMSNASPHVGKQVVLNLDLSDYFTSINFGRVRGLLMSRPFELPKPVATAIAQLCCYHGHLPQGAPTSPVLANLVTHRLDLQLLRLASAHRATYTRYADDMTFSFASAKLPRDIVRTDRDGNVQLGERLTTTIESNGFKVNEDKVRLANRAHSRLAVTGITVNETPNVQRKYVRQVRSMLYAWKQHGVDAAEAEYAARWDRSHRPSGKPKSFPNVVRGKLLHMSNVRGRRDDIYCRAALLFNQLVARDGLDAALELHVLPSTATERNAHDALWVVEAGTTQGTGFTVDGGLVVTCHHCVIDAGEALPEVTLYKCRDHRIKRRAKVVVVDPIRDLALCRPIDADMSGETCIGFSTAGIDYGTEVVLLGFPGYSEGNLEHRIPASVTSRLILGGAQRAVRRFEIDKTIHHGASGGPVVSVDGKLLGIATEGAVAVYGITGPSAPDGTDDMRDEPILGGHNIVVHREELKTFITESSGALQPYCAPNTISRASVGE